MSRKSATIVSLVVVAFCLKPRIISFFLPSKDGSNAKEIKKNKIPQVLPEREEPSNKSQSTFPARTSSRLARRNFVFLFFWILNFILPHQCKCSIYINFFFRIASHFVIFLNCRNSVFSRLFFVSC